MQILTDAKRWGGETYEIVLVSAKGGRLQSDVGVAVETEPMARWRDTHVDTLLISGGYGALAAAEDPSLIELTSALAQNATRVGSVCTGAHILAACGLLDGLRAVTHWSTCDRLASQHPKVTVEPDRIFVNNGRVWTSAGVTAGMDMVLAMVAEDSGRQLAIRLAKSLVMYMVRPGGQSQFSALLLSQSDDSDGRFDALHSWMQDNLQSDLRVELLAEKAGMSARNFARVYRAQTGRTPAKAVEMFRVAAARDLLEETMLSISTIARQVGFEDDERLRRAMQRTIGISPTACRERFRMEKP